MHVDCLLHIKTFASSIHFKIKNTPPKTSSEGNIGTASMNPALLSFLDVKWFSSV
jgi:hypothetical protein